MKEAAIEKHLVDACKAAKWSAQKLVNQSSPGWPDRTVVKPDGGIFFVECKTPRGLLSALQKHYIKYLEVKGHRVYISRSINDNNRIIEQEKTK